MRTLRQEGGFTTVVVMGLLLVGMLLVAAAFAAAQGDTSTTRHDQYYKQAYNAAEAGVNWYAYHLNQDPNYWAKCSTVGAPVFDVTATSSALQAGAQAIQGTDSKYAVELLPASGSTSCVANSPNSMIDPTSGTFKIRSTGYYRGVKRSIVATFKRKGFLNFLWFTNLETQDPVTYSGTTNQSKASKLCNVPAPRNSFCQDQAFIDGDNMQGPMHTNDQLLICGAPIFGRSSTDAIETVNASGTGGVGWRSACSGANPNIKGTPVWGAEKLVMPPSNAALKSDAASNYVYNGRTQIVLHGTTMDVTVGGVTRSNVSIPPVLYAQNTSCSTTFTTSETYPAPSVTAGCGDVWVRGNSSVDLTIGADNDVIIDGNLTHDDGVALGLIANGFIRVYHPCVSGTNQTTSDADPNVASTSNIQIEAAILSVLHSFVVDNWDCGAGLGNLNVTGAIAQNYRGTVGTFDSRTGDVSTGYLKDYTYDDSLRFHNPPYFLDPVQASWGIRSETEQIPPR